MALNIWHTISGTFLLVLNGLSISHPPKTKPTVPEKMELKRQNRVLTIQNHAL